MDWKFQRENHNRQDKAHKPDYREDFLGKSHFKATPPHLESLKEIWAFKGQLIRRYEQATFLFGGRYLRLDWTLKEYAQANNLNENVNRRFKPHKVAAERDLQTIRDAIRNAHAIWGISKKGEQQPKVVFVVHLNCERIIPFRKDDDDFEVDTLQRKETG